MRTDGIDAARRDAYIQAYVLFERVQGEDHVAAVSELISAAEFADQAGWPEVRFVLDAARVVHDMARAPQAESTSASVTALVRSAEELKDASALAVAIGLRAFRAAISGDTAALLSDASRAVALLDDDALPPTSRCLGYVIAAGAFNTLSLWELVDELYQRALQLDGAAAAQQTDAVAVNRVLIRLEWALTLLENGDDDAAEYQFAQVLAAAPTALDRPLRPLWRSNVLASRDIVRLLSPASRAADDSESVPAIEASVTPYRTVMRDGGDLETLPLLEAALALAYWRDGDQDAARAASERAMSPRSFAAGARSFPYWARAQLAEAGEAGVMAAQHEYARLVSRMRWQSRAAVLAAARAQISVERRKADHDRLHHAVQTDPLTGLRNRRVFDLWLQEGGADFGGLTALLLIDLDGFKSINDTFGHHCGDEVLRRVGRLMRELSRADDLAIRHGGDEFALILREDHLVEEAAVARAQRLAQAVAAEPWNALYDGLSVSVSIGVACAVVRLDGPDYQTGVGLLDAEQLYLAADAALYESKRSGRAVTVAQRTSAP